MGGDDGGSKGPGLGGSSNTVSMLASVSSASGWSSSAAATSDMRSGSRDLVGGRRDGRRPAGRASFAFLRRLRLGTAAG
jgi:hypothetical protein